MKFMEKKFKTIHVCEYKFQQNLSRNYLCIIFLGKIKVLYEIYRKKLVVTNNYVHLLYMYLLIYMCKHIKGENSLRNKTDIIT